ncbi:MAG: response regulator [Polyangiales bacterium]
MGSARAVEEAVVVVADDDRTTREHVCQLLRARGLKVIAADSGQKAIDAVRAQPVDLVALELNMPGLNGIDTCKVIKSITQDRFVPVVLMTPRGDMGGRAMRTGADEQLSKTVGDRELLDRLENMLRVKRTHDDVEFAKNELGFAEDSVQLRDVPGHLEFHAKLESEFEEAERHLDPLACCIVAIDDFRDLLCDQGPDCAAKVLAEVGARLQRATRPTDFVARYRPTEFGLLLPNTRPARALTLSESIISEVSNMPLTVCPASPLVTVSVGVGLYPSGNVRTHSELLDAASIAVARARVAGKNRVCVVQQQGYIFLPTGPGAT